MPEGPEVTIIAKSLNSQLKNKFVVDFEFNDKSRYRSKLPDGYHKFKEDLINKEVTIKSVNNKGKFIYWEFSNGFFLMQTLGLSGGWFFNEHNNSGCTLYFKDWHNGVNIKKLYYDDQRRFGTLKFIDSKQELNKKLKSIGPDILNEHIEPSEWLKIFKSKNVKNKNIVKVITNQNIISGIGNYLKAEILYKAHISPHRIVETLSDSELIKLYKASKNCIRESYNAGGTSLQNYSDVDGKMGNYGLELEVYRQKYDKHGNKVKAEKIGKDSQTTYWVPAIQK